MSEATTLTTARSVHEYTRARGFEESHYEKAGWQVAPLKIAKEALGHTVYQHDLNAFALIFHYHNPDATPMGFATIRIIRPVSGFTGDSGPKMLSMKGKPPRVYFPKSVDWLHLPDGAEVQIHESVMKAEAAVKNGYFAVGISGCWGWASRQHRISLLDDFSLLPWVEKSLKPIIVFDSNTCEGYPEFKPDLGLAIQRFAGALSVELNITAQQRKIPKGPDNKSWGYDDWATQDGGGRFQGEPSPIDPDMSRAVRARINTQIAYCQSMSRFICIDPPHTVMTRGEFVTRFGNYTYVKEDGSLGKGAEAWILAQDRNEVKKLEYAPGEPQWVLGEFINLWDGWGCTPKDGDASPFYEHLNNLMEGAEAHYFLDWIAYHLQFPKEKKSTVVPILVGPQGIGKSIISYLLRKIHGERNSAVVGPQQLESQFNSYLAERTLVCYEEAKKLDNKLGAKLLSMATDDVVFVNKKNQPNYTIRNTASIIVTTNDHDAITMDSTDRRWFVPTLSEKVSRVGDAPYFTKLAEMSVEALFASLLKRDIRGFAPFAPAPQTRGRSEMAIASHDAIYEWLLGVKDNIGDRCVVTAQELETVYLTQAGVAADMAPARAKRISDNLRKMGYQLANNGLQVKVGGSPRRYWIIKPEGKLWTSSEVQNHVISHSLLTGSKVD